MIFRSHRGGGYYTPENTMPAFRAALDSGLEQMETDPQFTAGTTTEALLKRLCVFGI